MNRYLTEKSKRVRWWHFPIAGFSLLLILVSIEVWVDDRDVGDFVVYLLAHLTEMALVAWPLIHVIRHWLRRHQARKLAPKLAQRKERAIPLGEVDRALGVRNAARKIRKLTGKGFLQMAAVDEDAQCLWLDNLETAAPEAPEPPADDVDCDETIRRIRQLNDDIDDAAVSEKIDRMEAVTASMLEAIAEDPDRAAEARRFMQYYLPTTLRLLKTYALMEEQSYQGETIQASRRRIEEVLDKLVHAAEQQQDKLFRRDALDMEADIQVLETMMASDGLTRTEGTR